MWLWELLKEIWAGYSANKAAKAAVNLPAGQAAVDAIKADGDLIKAELAKGAVPVTPASVPPTVK